MFFQAASEYAIRTLAALALEENPVFPSTLSQRVRVPESYLYKIFERLEQSRLVKRKKRKSGYVLAKSPEKIPILEIVESVQGSLIGYRCLVEQDCVDRDRLCQIFKDATEAFRKELSAHTLEDVILFHG